MDRMIIYEGQFHLFERPNTVIRENVQRRALSKILSYGERSAQDAEALGAIEAEVDAVLGRTLRASADNSVDAGTMAAFNLAFSQARDALRDRRQDLGRP